jgi:DNA-binding SARP family transcriptional activator
VHRLLVRERLLGDLRRRHRLALIALEAPAGFGRTVLLGQAAAEGPLRPSDRDVRYTCGPDDDRPGRLARALIVACGGTARRAPGPLADADRGARAVADALEEAVSADGQVALMVDDVDRGGAEGAALWAALVDRLPARGHLVLSGRRLPRVGLARQVAAGSALLLDMTDLAFRPVELAELGAGHPELGLTDHRLASWPAMAGLAMEGRPELAGDYLVESVLEGAGTHVAKGVAALAAVGGCTDDLLAAVVGAVDLGEPSPTAGPATTSRPDPVISVVRRLPLVEGGGGCWPHPVWAEATRSYLSADERERAVVAKARGLVSAGATHEAGRLALRSGSAAALALVVRAALASQPPLASLGDLKDWSASGILPAGSGESDWLGATVDLQLGDPAHNGAIRLEQVRVAYERDGDEEAEASLLLQLGHLARARSDPAELGRLLRRGEALADRGNPAARGLVALGRAVAAQMAGDPEAAITALEQVPPGAIVGEWAAQGLMVRGTSLLLCGRTGAAVAALDAATGEGSDASRAVAHDLLATARWYAGDPVGALADAGSAEALALTAGTPPLLQRVRANRACFLAASGQRDLATRALDQVHQSGALAPSDEATALARVAEALLAADALDLDGARTLIEATSVAERAVRSSVWKAALATALGQDDAGEAPQGPGERPGVALGRAVAAGRAAAGHLHGGPPVEPRHRPYLPSRWCAQSAPCVTISLLGAGTVHRDFRAADHPAWGRGRVRELCLHLALVEDHDRAGVAAALWPDREDRAAGQNLRVTLTHLLDVIDPGRARSRGSDLVVERPGSLRFSRESGLHVDLWDVERHAAAILATPGHERPSLLAHARRLVAVESGPLLGGMAVGEWLEPHRRRLDDLVVAAALHAGGHALAAGDHHLAEALALRALAMDPWSERAHRLVVESRLAPGDLDGARRATLHALSVLGDLGVDPAPDTLELVRRVGAPVQPVQPVQPIPSGRR